MTETIWEILATRTPELFIVFLMLVYFVRSLKSTVSELTTDIKEVHNELIVILKDNHIRMTKWESYFASAEGANADLKMVVRDLTKIVIQMEKDRARHEGYMTGKIVGNRDTLDLSD